MPEAIAIVVVVLIVGALLLAAWLKARHADGRHPAREEERLRQHLLWLEERRRHAEERHWGADLKQKLDDDLARMRAALARSATEARG